MFCQALDGCQKFQYFGERIALRVGERADRVGLKFESWQNEPAISPPGGNVRIARMVSAVHGTLLECDIPTKVFILHLNDEQLPSERFVIQDLDETHLLVQPHKIEMVRGEVKKFQEKSQYVPER